MHPHLERRFASALLGGVCLLPIAAFAPALAQEATPLKEITVTGTREGELRSETAASVGVVKPATIDDVKPAHPMEIINRVPGAVVVPTTGEGHQTAIRHPISTSPVYQFLEDGIPIRASGFFNHNALYEINIPQAGGVEVVRGPGSALQGSDAIAGVINVLTKPPSTEPEAVGTMELGSYGWARFLGTGSGSFDNTGMRGDLNITHWDGWRDSTAYDRQSATLRWDQFVGAGSFKTVVSGTNIEQQTGANSNISLTDYRNNPTVNYTPIAFRDVTAVRVSSAYEHEFESSLLSLTPYARTNEMTLLPSWQLSYDPVVYTTGHDSVGLLARYRQDFAPMRARVITGVDLDYSPGFREEWSLSTTKNGSIFTSYDKLAKIYSYDVAFSQASPYALGEISPVDKLRLSAGLRFDYMRYDYENNLSTLQTGRHRRPASTELDYTHLSPSVGITYEFMPTLNVFTDYKQAFRVPSESQLFRQGSNVSSIDLKPITADSFEVGVRRPETNGLSWELAAYYMIKKNDILTFTDGVNPTQTNGGETSHAGVEIGLGYTLLPGLRLDTAWSVSRHVYEDWRPSNSLDFSGNSIPLAPDTTGNTTLAWAPSFLPGTRFEAEWQYMSGYYINDLNSVDYDGHNLVNLRVAHELAPGVSLYGRVFNALDTRWATSGSVSGGAETYSPGSPRTFFAGITARF